MSTIRGDRPANIDRVHLDNGYYAEVLNEDKEQRLAYISDPSSRIIEEDALISKQLKARNLTKELTIQAAESGESYVLDVHQDNVVGSLVMDI